MKNLKFRWFGVTTSMLLIALITISFSSAAGESEASPLLFLPTESTGSMEWSESSTVTGYRYTGINFDLLEHLEVGSEIGLNVSEDTLFRALLDHKIALSGDGFALAGYIEGVTFSAVTIVSRGGQIAADITMPGGVYQVRYAGNDVHALLQIDSSAFPEDALPIPVNVPLNYNEPDLPTAPQDDGSTIDTMVVYTPAARDAEGGTMAIQNLIDLAVVEANQSYQNSGITQRLNLVHVMEVSYTESGDAGTDLTRLSNTADGYMDNVHPARNTYAADVVTMIEETSELCGIAYMMATVSASFETSAFSLVSRDCTTGYYSYAHELGHNMGANHDWYVEDSLNSPYSYNKGYINIQDEWRTIMAYNNECSDSGTSCQRLQYWSNPDVLYNGDPTGVPIGTSTACIAGDLFHPDCDADNRQTLNNTALTVANFRASGSDVGPLEYYSHLVDDDNSGDSVGDNDGVVDCGENIELYVDLINQGTDTAADVEASLSADDPHVTFLYNTSSSYPNITGGGTGENSDDYDIGIASGTPHGHVIEFDLDVSASNGGPWTDSFTVSVSCSGNNPPYTPSNPSPPDSATDVLINTDLGWAGGDPDGDQVTYDVYFEADDNTPDQLLCNDVGSTSCDPGMLSYSTDYYWRVVASDGQATTDGLVWSFTTAEETGGVSVTSVLTTDLDDNPKDTFEPGEDIRYYLVADNTTGMTSTASYEWHVSGPCGSVLDWTGDLETDTGVTYWYIETTTPTDCPGAHTFEGSVTYNAIMTTETTDFTVNPAGTPPGAFSKSSPSDGATGMSTNPTLSWGTSSDADSYEYCYDTTDDDACSTWIDNGTGTSVGLAGLSNGTTYYWHARAVNGSGTTYSNGGMTAYWSFTTGGPPGAFSKSTPTNGATEVSTSPTLSWGTSSDADSYEYCYDTSDDNACSTWIDNSASTSIGLSGLSYNTTYYWHARAENGFGTTYSNSSPTAFWSFTTGEATGGVSVFNVWTSDMDDIPKVTFGPGEGIRYYIAADNTTGSTAMAYFEWHVLGSCGTVVDWTGNLDTDSGMANWFIETTTPTNCSGPYTFEGSVTYNSIKTTDSTGFNVAYHLYTPMIVHQ